MMHSAVVEPGSSTAPQHECVGSAPAAGVLTTESQHADPAHGVSINNLTSPARLRFAAKAVVAELVKKSATSSSAPCADGRMRESIQLQLREGAGTASLRAYRHSSCNLRVLDELAWSIY